MKKILISILAAVAVTTGFMGCKHEPSTPVSPAKTMHTYTGTVKITISNNTDDQLTIVGIKEYGRSRELASYNQTTTIEPGQTEEFELTCKISAYYYDYDYDAQYTEFACYVTDSDGKTKTPHADGSAGCRFFHGYLKLEENDPGIIFSDYKLKYYDLSKQYILEKII